MVANQPLVSSLEMREQLQASLADSSASRVGDRSEEVSVPVRQSVQPVVVETQSTNSAILQAIQSLSARLVLTLLSKAVSQCQFIYMAELERVPRLCPQVDCQFQPKDWPMNFLRVILVMMVREKMMMKSPTTEREIVDLMTLQDAKLDPIPNTAAD